MLVKAQEQCRKEGALAFQWVGRILSYIPSVANHPKNSFVESPQFPLEVVGTQRAARVNSFGHA